MGTGFSTPDIVFMCVYTIAINFDCYDVVANLKSNHLTSQLLQNVTMYDKGCHHLKLKVVQACFNRMFWDAANSVILCVY